MSNKTRDWSRVVLDIGVAYEENVDEVIRVMREVGAALWDDDEWRQKPRAQPAVGGVEGLKTVRDPERPFAAARAKGTGG